MKNNLQCWKKGLLLLWRLVVGLPAAFYNGSHAFELKDGRWQCGDCGALPLKRDVATAWGSE